MSKLPATPRQSSRCLAVALLAFATLVGGCSHTEPASDRAQPPPAVDPVPAATAPVVEPPAPDPNDPRPKIVAFGDSLTAGFGLEKSQSYPAALQRLLDSRGYH